jgi:hypothetical protein
MIKRFDNTFSKPCGRFDARQGGRSPPMAPVIFPWGDKPRHFATSRPRNFSPAGIRRHLGTCGAPTSFPVRTNADKTGQWRAPPSACGDVSARSARSYAPADGNEMSVVELTQFWLAACSRRTTLVLANFIAGAHHFPSDHSAEFQAKSLSQEFSDRGFRKVEVPS